MGLGSFYRECAFRVLAGTGMIYTVRLAFGARVYVNPAVSVVLSIVRMWEKCKKETQSQ